MVVPVDGRSLTIEGAIDVAERSALVRADPKSLEQMDGFRALLERK